MAKKLTKAKARKILHDKTIHGKPITDKQRRYFAWIAFRKEYGGDVSEEDFEKWYQEGGTIYTSDPNDPRLKAYKDSLYLYKNGKLDYIDNSKPLEAERLAGLPLILSRKIPYNQMVNDPIKTYGMQSDVDKPLHSFEITDDYSRKTKNELFGKDSIKPEYFDDYQANYPDDIIHQYVPRYKKPVQPVVYQERIKQTEEPINNINSRKLESPKQYWKTFNMPQATSNNAGKYTIQFQDKTIHTDDEDLIKIARSMAANHTDKGIIVNTTFDTFSSKFEKGGIIIDPMGQWNHPGENTRIPGNQITMEGVPYNVLGIDNNGNKQLMEPDKNYSFPGARYVDEIPMAKSGIHIKPENKGLFTKYAHSKGMEVQEAARWVMKNSKNKKLRKRANFALNASKFKHAQFGYNSSEYPIDQATQIDLATNTSKNLLANDPTQGMNLQMAGDQNTGIDLTGYADMQSKYLELKKQLDALTVEGTNQEPTKTPKPELSLGNKWNEAQKRWNVPTIKKGATPMTSWSPEQGITQLNNPTFESQYPNPIGQSDLYGAGNTISKPSLGMSMAGKSGMTGAVGGTLLSGMDAITSMIPERDDNGNIKAGRDAIKTMTTINQASNKILESTGLSNIPFLPQAVSATEWLTLGPLALISANQKKEEEKKMRNRVDYADKYMAATDLYKGNNYYERGGQINTKSLEDEIYSDFDQFISGGKVRKKSYEHGGFIKAYEGENIIPDIPVYKDLSSFGDYLSSLNAKRTYQENFASNGKIYTEDNYTTGNFLISSPLGEIKYNCEGIKGGCTAMANIPADVLAQYSGFSAYENSDKTKKSLGMDYATNTPPTAEEIKKYPYFAGDPNFGSADAWDIPYMASINSPKNLIFSTDAKDKDELEKKSKTWGELKKELDVPIGSYINIKSGGRVAPNGKYAGSHTIRVIAYTENGNPIVADYGIIKELDDHAIISNIVSVPGKEKYTYSYYNDLIKKSNKKGNPYLTNFNLLPGNQNKLINAAPNYIKFHNALVDRKGFITSQLGIDNEKYDEYSKIALTLGAMETNYGKSTSGVLKSTLDKFGSSIGVTQLNLDNVKDKYKKTLSKFEKGTEEYNAVATILYLKELDQYKDKWLKQGESAQERPYYLDHSDVKDLIRENFQGKERSGYIEGYGFHNYFKEGNNEYELPTKQPWQSKESYIKEVNESFKKQKANNIRFDYDSKGRPVVYKKTAGNMKFNNLAEQIFYLWNSPNTVRYGDAEGKSKYYKNALEIYKKLFPDKKEFGGFIKAGNGTKAFNYLQNSNPLNAVQNMYDKSQQVFIKDNRKIQPVIGKPIDPYVDLKTDNYDINTIGYIIDGAKRFGIDPYHALGAGLQETNLGKTDPNIGHTRFTNSLDAAQAAGYTDEEIAQMNEYQREALNMTYAMKLKQDEAIKAGITDPAKILQFYNGTDILSENTEKSYHNKTGRNTNKFYGIDVTNGNYIDTKKNPVYGKTIISLADSVFKLNPKIKYMVDNYKISTKENGGFIKAQDGKPKMTRKFRFNNQILDLNYLPNNSFKEIRYPGGELWGYEAPELPELTITGKHKKSARDFFNRHSKEIAENYGNSPLGAIIGAPIMSALSLPQQALTYALSKDRYLNPSDALNVKNPVGRFLTDAVLDPTNLIGAGLVDDALKLTPKIKSLAKNSAKKLGNDITNKTIENPQLLKLRDIIIDKITSVNTEDVLSEETLKKLVDKGVIKTPKGTLQLGEFSNMEQYSAGYGKFRQLLQHQLRNTNQFTKSLFDNINGKDPDDYKLAKFTNKDNSFFANITIPKNNTIPGEISNFTWRDHNPKRAGKNAIDLINMLDNAPLNWEINPGSLSGDSFPLWMKIIGRKLKNNKFSIVDPNSIQLQSFNGWGMFSPLSKSLSDPSYMKANEVIDNILSDNLLDLKNPDIESLMNRLSDYNRFNISTGDVRYPKIKIKRNYKYGGRINFEPLIDEIYSDFDKLVNK